MREIVPDKEKFVEMWEMFLNRKKIYVERKRKGKSTLMYNTTIVDIYTKTRLTKSVIVKYWKIFENGDLELIRRKNTYASKPKERIIPIRVPSFPIIENCFIPWPDKQRLMSGK